LLISNCKGKDSNESIGKNTLLIMLSTDFAILLFLFAVGAKKQAIPV